MAQQQFNDGDTGLQVRTTLNSNAADAEMRLGNLEANEHDPATLNADATTQETLNLLGQEFQVNPATSSTAGAATAAQITKLDGIESGAEVNQTDSEIKTQYEANPNTNAFTDAEQSKLSGIEAGAEVNQTDAEIKTQYEANPNTNAFTDADETKLDGIEAGAQVNTVDDVNGKTGSVSISEEIFTDYNPGVTVGPSTTATTSGTAPVLAEMEHTFTPANATNEIEAYFSGTFETDDKKEGAFCGIFVDGTLQPETVRDGRMNGDDDDDRATLATQWSGQLSAASHTIDVRFWTTDNTISNSGVKRSLIVKETGQP